MKQRIVAMFCMIALPFVINAQGGIFNKVKSKVKQRTDQKVDKAIDKTLDKAESKSTGAAKDTSVQPSSAPAVQPPAVVPDTTGIKNFSKYDFVAGDKIIYYDDFDQDVMAELPVGWNTSGTGEITEIGKYPGKWLRLHNPFVYLSRNEKKFADNYTIEFDIILQLKNNGWMYPEISFGLIGTQNEPAGGNAFLKEYKKYAAVMGTMMPGEFGTTKLRLNSYLDDKNYFKGDPKPFANLEKNYGKPVHVAIQVQQERFRMWVNEEKLFDVPKGMPLKYTMNQLIFQVGRTNYKEDQYGVYLGNIKVATGVADTRHKLIEEGRFSTTAILFDVNTASIKPESGGVLKEIADVLNQAQDVRIKIIGHTDSDGNDKANLTLSQKRATAVKDALVNEFSVDATRIKTEGKGEAKPVADNKTKEGKAQNRRVEFVKQ